MNEFLGFKTEEILTFVLLIVVGYVIAKMFSGCGCSSGNGFSVGAVCPVGPNVCTGTDQTDFCYNKQGIDGLNNGDARCYEQYYNYSNRCKPSDDRIVIPIDDVVQEGRNKNWSPRCFSWDKNSDPREIYGCDMVLGNESCQIGQGNETIANCAQYCGIDKFACMKVVGGMVKEDGYQCRKLTLEERRNNHNGILPDDINPDNIGIYDTKNECNAAKCGYECVKGAGNFTSCEPNKNDTVAYKDHLTCQQHCRYVYVCRKGSNDDCYKTKRILTDDELPGETPYETQSECKRDCEDKNHYCNKVGQDNICKCVEDTPEVFCNKINKIHCFPEDDCDMKCKSQSMYEYRCPSGNDEYTQAGSHSGCGEFPCDEKNGCGGYGFDSNAISPGSIEMLKENCNSGVEARTNIKDKDDIKALVNENGTRDITEVCNRGCSTEESHFQRGECTKVGNQCVKKGTIKNEYKPTGIFANDTCDIPNKICNISQAQRSNCILDCNIPVPPNKCDVSGSDCYQEMKFKDEYGRVCPETQKVSCISLPIGAFNNKDEYEKCNLNIQIQDVKDVIDILWKWVYQNTQNINKINKRIDSVKAYLDTQLKLIRKILESLLIQMTELRTRVASLEKLQTDYKNQLNTLNKELTAMVIMDIANGIEIRKKITDIQANISTIQQKIETEGKNLTNIIGQINAILIDKGIDQISL